MQKEMMNDLRYRIKAFLLVFFLGVTFAFAQSNGKEAPVTNGQPNPTKWYQLKSKATGEGSVSVFDALTDELIDKSEAILPGKVKQNYLLVDSVSMELMAKDSVPSNWANKAKYKALAMFDDDADSNVWASFLAPFALLLAFVYSAYSLIKLFVIRED